MASIKKQLKLKIKEEQKIRASSIKLLKLARKPSVYALDPTMYDKLGSLDRLRYDYRHIHIAYCTYFNNTAYEDIERTCDEMPSDNYLLKLKVEWNSYIRENTDETVCVSA
jgi:hypothetical protein